MQTFNVQPFVGVYWVETGQTINFGMPLAEFDILFEEAQKFSSEQSCGTRITPFFTADFDSENKICEISFWKDDKLRLMFNDVDLFTHEDVITFLVAKSNGDVWEANVGESLVFPSLGIDLQHFDDSSEYDKLISLFVNISEDNLHRMFHAYPPPSLEKFGEFHVLPGTGVYEPKLGTIKLGDAWEKLVPRWDRYFPAHELKEKAKFFLYTGFEIYFGNRNACDWIDIDTEVFDVFIDDIKIGAKNWQDYVLSLDKHAFYSKSGNLFCPELKIIYSAMLKDITICTKNSFAKFLKQE